MPISRQARMMRTAISPRLAIRTRLNMTGAKPQLHGIVPEPRRKKGSPPEHSPEEWIVLHGRAAGRGGGTGERDGVLEIQVDIEQEPICGQDRAGLWCVVLAGSIPSLRTSLTPTL